LVAYQTDSLKVLRNLRAPGSAPMRHLAFVSGGLFAADANDVLSFHADSGVSGPSLTTSVGSSCESITSIRALASGAALAVCSARRVHLFGLGSTTSEGSPACAAESGSSHGWALHQTVTLPPEAACSGEGAHIEIVWDDELKCILRCGVSKAGMARFLVMFWPPEGLQQCLASFDVSALLSRHESPSVADGPEPPCGELIAATCWLSVCNGYPTLCLAAAGVPGYMANEVLAARWMTSEPRPCVPGPAAGIAPGGETPVLRFHAPANFERSTPLDQEEDQAEAAQQFRAQKIASRQADKRATQRAREKQAKQRDKERRSGRD